MGSLPTDWTSANVIPVYKRDHCIVSNYRPISLTSIIVKVIEKIICKQLTTALEQSNRLSDAQFGFHAKRSTVSLLLSAVHDWSLSLELCNSAHCVFLDFAKAFDSVAMNTFLLNCSVYNVYVLFWLIDYSKLL